MKDFESHPPLHVASAQGSILTLDDGRQIIDCVSSWWCKSVGYGHPALRNALMHQAQQLEHCMLGSATHEPIELLSRELTSLILGLNHITYASDGSSAVEIAMKMSLHAHQIMGQSQRTTFAALSGSYHGETCAALSVSDLGQFRAPYQSMLMRDVIFLNDVPYVHSRDDALWQDCSSHWAAAQLQLDACAKTLSAVLIEPIVQGSNHMRIYSADFLKRLRAWCDANGVHLIADEIMTGFGRTGKWFACEHADITPDFMCLGKALTGGFLPMSAVLTLSSIYDLFYNDYSAGNNFLHSHTFSGNPLAAAVARAHLKVIQDELLITRAADHESTLLSCLRDVAHETGMLNHVRGIGMVVAADLINANHTERFGFDIQKKALQEGLLLRPLGNTIYLMLPLNITAATLDDIKQRLLKVLYVDR